MPRDVGVILAAAGQGIRFGTPVPKQYQLLGQSPVLLHAVRAFITHPDISDIVVVLSPADALHPPDWLAPLLGSSMRVIAGGVTRRDSVRAGLDALPARCTVVIVHDGARPFPVAGMIDAGIASARAGRSAVPALPVGDTIKRVDDFGRVLSTVDRTGLWFAQTPQVFPRTVLARAHSLGDQADPAATDDAVLVERLGEPVEVIPGSARNVKITTRHDLALAEWYLANP